MAYAPYEYEHRTGMSVRTVNSVFFFLHATYTTLQHTFICNVRCRMKVVQSYARKVNRTKPAPECRQFRYSHLENIVGRMAKAPSALDIDGGSGDGVHFFLACHRLIPDCSVLAHKSIRLFNLVG